MFACNRIQTASIVSGAGKRRDGWHCLKHHDPWLSRPAVGFRRQCRLAKCSPHFRAIHSGRASQPPEQRRAVKSRCVDAYEGQLTPLGKFGIVVSKFNELITENLLSGALSGLKRFGVDEDDIDVAWVPGSFELPIVAKSMAKSGAYEAVICVGAVIRGSTSHYDAVVSGATSGVLNASLDTGVPVIFGVLTCDNMEQALDRAGGKLGNKGYEFAITALETAHVLASLKHDRKASPHWGVE